MPCNRTLNYAAFTPKLQANSPYSLATPIIDLSFGRTAVPKNGRGLKKPAPQNMTILL
jgi:hypothetical protein